MIFEAEGNQDVLRHAVIPWRHRMALRLIAPRIVEDAYDRRVLADQDPYDAPGAPAVRPWRSQFHEYLIALHRPAYVVGRNEDVAIAVGRARLRTDKAEAIPVQVKTAGGKFAARRSLGQRPVVPIRSDQCALRRQPVQLLDQQPAIPPTVQAEFADQLLIAGALPGRSLDAVEEFTVVHGIEDGRGFSPTLSMVTDQAPPARKRIRLGDFNFSVRMVKIQHRPFRLQVYPGIVGDLARRFIAGDLSKTGCTEHTLNRAPERWKRIE